MQPPGLAAGFAAAGSTPAAADVASASPARAARVRPLLRLGQGPKVAAAAAAAAAALAAVLARLLPRPLEKSWRHALEACFSLEEKKRVGIANPSDDLDINVVCDHSRAHTLDDDSLTLET